MRAAPDDSPRARLARRLAKARRVLVVCGPGLFPWPRPERRGAEVLWEMARFYAEILLLDEESGQAAWEGRAGRVEGDAASLGARFLAGGADLCLVAGAPCATPEAAGAVVAAWRAGVWLAEAGEAPGELAPLVHAACRGWPDAVLDEVWEAVLRGEGRPAAGSPGDA